MAKVVHINRDTFGVTDATLQDAVLNVTEARQVFPDLLAIAHKRDDIIETYNAAVDAAAHKSGASKKAIKAVVRAIVKDKTRDMFAEASEFLDLLEAMVPGVAKPEEGT
jgi:hypothetical protein